MLLFATAILVSLPVLIGLAQSELAPEEDNGSLFVVATPPDYSNLEYTEYFLDQMIEVWKKIPEVSHSWQINSPNEVFGGLELKLWDERERSQQEVQAEAQAGFAEDQRPRDLHVRVERAARCGLRAAHQLRGRVDGRLRRDRPRSPRKCCRVPVKSGLFAFVNKTLRYSRPEITVSIDRDLAARLGISMQDIGDTLQIMLGEAESNRFSLEGKSYKVIPQADPGFRLTKEWLQRYYLRTDSGDLVPLSTVISLDQRVEPNSLRQFQQLNSATIQGSMMPPHALGTGLEFLQRTLDEVAPIGYRAGYEGESRRLIQESQSFGQLFAASLVFIFLVLSAQFNSFRDPLVVLVSVPLSMFGAVVPLALGWVTLNIYTQVGLLTLIGLISKHGILIVDFANHLVAEGMDRRQAVLEAAALRLRPILMTTFATVLGVVPLLLAVGAGANSRYAIGMMIAAGMMVGSWILAGTILPEMRSNRPESLRGEVAEQLKAAVLKTFRHFYPLATWVGVLRAQPEERSYHFHGYDVVATRRARSDATFRPIDGDRSVVDGLWLPTTPGPCKDVVSPWKDRRDPGSPGSNRRSGS